MDAEKENVEKEPVTGEQLQVPDVKAEEPADKGVSRRNFVAGAAGAVVLLGVGGLKLVGDVQMVRPPGGQDEANLLAKCTRCSRCIEACPQGIIRPAHLEDGIVSMRTPYLDYSSNRCTFCRDEDDAYPHCEAACLTGALDLTGAALPFIGNSKKSIENLVLGKASIDEYQCLAYRDTNCHNCYDYCPYDAIKLEEPTANQRLQRPVVVTEMCNGCGTCQSVCLSLTAGSVASNVTEVAITVKPVQA